MTFSDFIAPPNNVGTIKKDNGNFGMVLTDLPLGIISLSAYLKKHIPIQTEAIDFNVVLNKLVSFDYDSFKSLFDEYVGEKKAVSTADYDYIGISALFTSSHKSIIDLAEVSRKHFPNSRIIVGGNYPTAAYGKLLSESPNIDAICFGEGEKPLLELITAQDFEQFVSESQQWIDHKKLQNPLRTLSHNFIIDLDAIPPYDYDCVDVDGYRLNPNSARYKVDGEKSRDLSGEGEPESANQTGVKRIGQSAFSLPIMTSRGCPFKCTFCASHVAHGRDMRYHSLERVLGDIEILIQKYGIDGVVIQDDHFMAGKYRPYEIVKAIGDRGLGMYFQNALAVYALDYPFLKLLKESGVDSLVIPLESGSNRVLKELMRKPLRLDIVPRVLKDCRDAGIFTDINIILGMPGETENDILESRAFLKTIYGDWFRVFSAMPIAGSEMYERCIQEGLFEASELDANYKRPVINTGQLTPGQVLDYTYLLNIELNFVFNSNLRLGKYDIALRSFLNVLKVKEDHAIALYYAGFCFSKLGELEKADSFFEDAKAAVTRDGFWQRYVDEFNIPIFNPQESGTDITSMVS
jgi:radical SAM superfamily enzyme YgiQ (UPF0313 family)